MTPEELRSKSPADLNTQMSELQEELFRLRLARSTGQLEKNHRLKELRRNVARIRTILGERARKGN